MSRRIRTESGAVYIIDGDRVLRVDDDSETKMRRDGEWLRMLEPPVIKVGAAMVLWLEPLSTEASMTQRITSPVVEATDE